MQKRIDLSIIVVTYHSAEFIETCIHEIIRDVRGELQFEIIAIDNASQDETLPKLKQYQVPELTVISNSKNLGFAKACNIGMKQARGKAVLLLNPDVRVRNKAITHSYNFLRTQKHAGIVGCRLINPGGDVIYSCRHFPTPLSRLWIALGLHLVFPRSPIFNRFYMGYFDYRSSREVDAVSGAFFMINRETIEDIGLLDERFFMYSEEIDYCMRAKQRGWRVLFYGEAEAEHIVGHSALADENIVPLFVQQHKSNQLFYAKHFSLGKRVAFFLISFLETGIRFAAWSFLNRFRHNKRTSLNKDRYKAAFLWYVHHVNWLFSKSISMSEAD